MFVTYFVLPQYPRWLPGHLLMGVGFILAIFALRVDIVNSKQNLYKLLQIVNGAFLAHLKVIPGELLRSPFVCRLPSIINFFFK
jgi:hypothetical protein